MARATNALTQARIDKAAPGKIHFDGLLKGFGIRVRERMEGTKLVRTVTFVVKRDMHGATKTVTLGSEPSLRLGEARKRAERLIVSMKDGKDPAGAVPTLRQALEEHVQNMRNKGCTDRSLESIRYRIEHYAKALLDRPLDTITRHELRGLHARVSAKGRYVANSALRNIRTVWNTARTMHPQLDAEPTAAVPFHKQRRRQEPIAWDALPAWWAKVDAMENPVRRDLQRFILFTGLRRDDAKTVRWEHVDFDAGTLHRPKPKGGTDRAFTVPVSRYVLELLRRRQAENREQFPAGDGGWCFPTLVQDDAGRLRVTHVQEVKQQHLVDGHKVPYVPSPHRLRDTFATAAHEAEVDHITLKVLLNHSLPSGDVTAGYLRPSEGFLREAAEKVAAFLLERAGQVGYLRALESPRSSVG